MPPNEYYEPCVRPYREVDNQSAVKIYFEETEPKGGLPTHQRVLLQKKAESIANAMIYRLIRDVWRCTRYSWNPGRPIPGKSEHNQPMADSTTKAVYR